MHLSSILAAPKLQSQSPASIETSASSYVSIHCAFSGLPAPTITWQKVNGNISSAANISFTTTTANGSYPVVNSTITFNRIDKEEHGIYECIARNPAGSPSVKISINVACMHYCEAIKFLRTFFILPPFLHVTFI